MCIRDSLQDLQSFKQIDIYAFSLVMWEIMSRCCVIGGELGQEGVIHTYMEYDGVVHVEVRMV